MGRSLTSTQIKCTSTLLEFLLSSPHFKPLYTWTFESYYIQATMLAARKE